MSRDRMNDFNKSTEVIQTKIQQFQSSITEIDQLFAKNLNTIAGQEGSKLLVEKTKAANGLSSEIYERLRALTSANMKVRTKEEYDQRKLRTTTLSRQFKEAVSRFQGIQYQNGQKSKETLARQYRIANPAATEEDIQRLVNEDQGGVFSQQLLQQARGQQAAAALNSVQDRQREIHKLQESIVELSQLYTQLEHLISDQDHTFQEIEASVMRTEDNMEKGLTSVIGARDQAISARKKKWMCLGIIVLVIIIILIIGATQGWFSKKQ
ncbi:Plasma membrane t-SNARE, secretory vesicle fusion [Mortierella sp. AD011]|nr:Plasma membrane t-SNARE, secretory vesicle fusion [Mortierella sp. AD010]KAF9397415.1 Plasma membrane t-SNARE, secretory vesicle fusion [Mortierella sp. AD011]